MGTAMNSVNRREIALMPMVRRKALRYFFYNRAGIAGHGVSEIKLLHDPSDNQSKY